MVLPFLLTGGRAPAVELLRAEPTAVEHALEAMAATLGACARAAVDTGADGVFYATNMPTASSCWDRTVRSIPIRRRR